MRYSCARLPEITSLSVAELFVGFMAVQTYQNLAYLFFLAIEPAYRSKGYGSQAIKTLKAEYPDKKQAVDFYEVFCIGEDFEPKVFKAMMKTIQVNGFSPEYFCK